MKCYIVMAILLAMGLDESEGLPDDCKYDSTAEKTNCLHFCGFTTSWTTCENNVCCCGYGNKWHAFRFREGERCSGDPVEVPKTIHDCVPHECEQTCGNVAYQCVDNCCQCQAFNYNGEAIGWHYRNCW